MANFFMKGLNLAVSAKNADFANFWLSIVKKFDIFPHKFQFIYGVPNNCLSFIFVLVPVTSQWFSFGKIHLWFTDFVIGGDTFCLFLWYFYLSGKKNIFVKYVFCFFLHKMAQLCGKNELCHKYLLLILMLLMICYFLTLTKRHTVPLIWYKLGISGQSG